MSESLLSMFEALDTPSEPIPSHFSHQVESPQPFTVSSIPLDLSPPSPIFPLSPSAVLPDSPIDLGPPFSDELLALFKALDTPLEALDAPSEPQLPQPSALVGTQFNNNDSAEPMEYSSSATLSAPQSTSSSQSGSPSQSASPSQSTRVSRPTRKKRGQVLNGNENEAGIQEIAKEKLSKKEKHRLSAQDARLRKKQQLESLQQEVASLRENLEDMKRREAQMSQTVQRLAQEKAMLEQENANSKAFVAFYETMRQERETAKPERAGKRFAVDSSSQQS